MKKAILQSMLILLSLTLLACTNTAATQKNYSGFLSDYSTLEKVKLAEGGTAMRWVSPSLKQKTYTRVYIDPLVVYPAPKDEKQVDAKLVREAAAYLEQSVRQQLQGVIQVVDEPEAGALRMRAAITAVETPTESFKPYEVIPIALIIYSVSSATGVRDHNINAYLEVEVTDIDTGEAMVRTVKKGISDETLENNKAKVGMAQLKPTLDRWANDAVNFTKAFLQ